MTTVALFIVGVILVVLGSVLMGTAPSIGLTSGSAQFIAGFVFMMLFAMYLVNLLVAWWLWDWPSLWGFLVFLNVVMALLIAGSTLVGVAPTHDFAAGGIFVAGFALLIIFAALVVIGVFAASLYWCPCSCQDWF